MKNYILAVLLLTIPSLANINFAIDRMQMCTPVPETGKYDDCQSVLPSYSMFIILEGGNMVRHIAKSMVSMYYLNNAVYDEETKTVTADAISDAGNNYTFGFSAGTKKVIILGTDEEGSKYMLIFFAKSVTTSEED